MDHWNVMAYYEWDTFGSWLIQMNYESKVDDRNRVKDGQW